MQWFPSRIKQKKVLMGFNLLKIKIKVRSRNSNNIKTIIWLKQYVVP